MYQVTETDIELCSTTTGSLTLGVNPTPTFFTTPTHYAPGHMAWG